MRSPYLIGVFLAAGKSRRMGQNKLALPLKGENIGSLSLKTALSSRLDHVLVVERTEHASLEWIGAPYHAPPFQNAGACTFAKTQKRVRGIQSAAG